MKIRTIIGVLLVLALVLGSTGVGAAADGDPGEPQYRNHGEYCPNSPCVTNADTLITAGVCDPDCDNNGYGDGDCESEGGDENKYGAPLS